MPTQSIEEVLQQHTDEWMAIPGVVGAGIGECAGEACIKIFVARDSEELREKLPTTAGGYTVKIEETGRFRARPQ